MSYLGLVPGGGGGTTNWGDIGGLLSNQTDLQAALDLKANVTDLDAKADLNQLGPYRNKIINGNFDIWQRGTSQTGNGYGSADRWACSSAGSSHVVAQQTFFPGETSVPGNPTHYCRVAVTSVAGPGNFTYFRQPIEGVRTLAGGPAVLTFWAKAAAPGPICFEGIQGFGTGGTPSTSVTNIGVTTINLTTSWQKFTVPMSVPSILGKILGTDNNDAFVVNFWLEAGSDFNARTNNLGQRSGTYDFAQIQIEAGTEETPFEDRHVQQEFNLCTRYCRAWQAQSVFSVVGTCSISQVTDAQCPIQNIDMRVPPALATAPANQFALALPGGGFSTCTLILLGGQANTKTHTQINAVVAGGLTAGGCVRLVANNTTAAYYYLEAEL